MTTRKLSPAEISRLEQVFKKSIHYDRVNVRAQTSAEEANLQGRSYTVYNPKSKESTINVPQAKYDDLFEDTNTAKTAVHEAVHVWQGQHTGVAYMAKGLYAQHTVGADVHAAYDYTVPLKQGIPWSAMNVESEAEMVADAYVDGYFDRPGKSQDQSLSPLKMNNVVETRKVSLNLTDELDKAMQVIRMSPPEK